jgi:hypothetical protein
MFTKSLTELLLKMVLEINETTTTLSVLMDNTQPPQSMNFQILNKESLIQKLDIPMQFHLLSKMTLEITLLLFMRINFPLTKTRKIKQFILSTQILHQLIKRKGK